MQTESVSRYQPQFDAEEMRRLARQKAVEAGREELLSKASDAEKKFGADLAGLPPDLRASLEKIIVMGDNQWIQTENKREGYLMAYRLSYAIKLAQRLKTITEIERFDNMNPDQQKKELPDFNELLGASELTYRIVIRAAKDYLKDPQILVKAMQAIGVTKETPEPTVN